ncbi:MAG: T9SS type A sorting domain-containing protein [Saprospiraceae bacterium]|nr:T9SS type A sorting domain-containing protein [Saprospiraceae bacterium]MBK7809723.1 T9SS type A sorting domain-containing protein [Saprospiraceae bacterium]MBK9632167.1 T9SS type A sorting domain-containing protein [Saprospiraceae bacterium]
MDWLFVDKAEGTWGEKIFPYDSNHWLLVLDDHEGFKIRVMNFDRKTKSEVIFYHFRYIDFVSVYRQDSVLLKDKLENVHVLSLKNQKGRVAFNWMDKMGMKVESEFLFSTDDYAYFNIWPLDQTTASSWIYRVHQESLNSELVYTFNEKYSIWVSPSSVIWENGFHLIMKHHASGEKRILQFDDQFQLLKERKLSEYLEGYNRIATDPNGFAYITGSKMVGPALRGFVSRLNLDLDTSWFKLLPTVFPDLGELYYSWFSGMYFLGEEHLILTAEEGQKSISFSSKAIVFLMNSSGKFIWNRFFEPLRGGNSFSDAIINKQKKLTLIGTTNVMDAFPSGFMFMLQMSDLIPPKPKPPVKNDLIPFVNPVKDHLKILDLDQLDRNFKIYQMQGKLLLRGNLTQDMDLSFLYPGYYLIAIDQIIGTVYYKMIKR